jgi:flagellar basal body-associated protein FliL
MICTIQLYHWKTHSYAVHKATDELNDKVRSVTDKMIEILLGKTGNRIEFSSPHVSLKQVFNPPNPDFFKREIERYKNFLIKLDQDKRMKQDEMTNTDLYNLRDELVGHLNQFLYLATFN